MSKFSVPTKPGVRARERNALERIEAVENDLGFLGNNFTVFTQSVESALTEIDHTVGNLLEVVDALVAELGPEVVAKRISDARREKAEKDAKAAQEAVSVAVTDGTIRQVDLVGEYSLIVGREVTKDGEVVPPGYAQLRMASIKPEFREKFLNQCVGTKIETAEGMNTFEIVEIYDSTREVGPEPVEEADPIEESPEVEA